MNTGHIPWIKSNSSLTNANRNTRFTSVPFTAQSTYMASATTNPSLPFAFLVEIAEGKNSPLAAEGVEFLREEKKKIVLLYRPFNHQQHAPPSSQFLLVLRGFYFLWGPPASGSIGSLVRRPAGWISRWSKKKKTKGMSHRCRSVGGMKGQGAVMIQTTSPLQLFPSAIRRGKKRGEWKCSRPLIRKRNKNYDM